ncbi:hypothetical protein ONZ45_g12156 [Pleurotus djamor]|nr:hypothetical protein ONZ45_g12156 [Pleurotus djamor]
MFSSVSPHTRSYGQPSNGGTTPARRLGLADMPDKVLVRILSQSYSFVEGPDRTASEIPDIKSIQALALVCKSFARVILSTPSFWTTIVCGADAHILDAHLKRVGTLEPLRFLRSDISRRPLAAPSVHLILSKLARLEELKIPILRSSVPILSRKLHGRAPLLRALEVYVWDALGCPPLLLHDSALFQGARPTLLASLKLGGVYIPWTSPLICPTLTSLSLHSQPRFDSYARFRHTFLPLQNLEELSLTDCLPLATTGIGATLHLPRLKKLVIVDNVPAITSVLSSLVASPESLIIHGAAIKHELPPFLHACTRLLTRYHPSAQTPHYLSGFHLNRDQSTLQFQCVASARENPLLRKPVFEAKLNIEKGTSIGSTVAATIQGLPLTEVEVLTLFHFPGDAAELWLNVVARQIPKLRSIVVQQPTSIEFLKAYGKYLDELNPCTPHESQAYAGLMLIQSVRLVNVHPSVRFNQVRADEEEAFYFSEVIRRRLNLGLPEIGIRT